VDFELQLVESLLTTLQGAGERTVCSSIKEANKVLSQSINSNCSQSQSQIDVHCIKLLPTVSLSAKFQIFTISSAWISCSCCGANE
jgi:hypothetical protein